MIPQNYQEWRHCITVECGLELTPEYIEKRSAALNNEKGHHTKQFKSKYGAAHLHRVIEWFLQAQRAT